MADFQKQYDLYREAVEGYLDKLFTSEKPYGVLYQSMRYSLLSGGKRIRPVLTLEFARISGVDWQKALQFACALEMVHTYSLIHDDLPCMDNDTLRRGKPTNHVKFGETMATLAGDALQPEAYRVLLSAPLSEHARTEAALVLANASGADGMVAGQVLDLTDCSQDEQQLHLLHSLKTGAMIVGAAELGAVAAENEPMRKIARAYASSLGLAFQIQDDLLDVIGDEKTFGKPIGSDREEGKTTFVDLFGIDGCREKVTDCTAAALDAIRDVKDNEFLITFAQKLANRIY